MFPRIRIKTCKLYLRKGARNIGYVGEVIFGNTPQMHLIALNCFTGTATPKFSPSFFKITASSYIVVRQIAYKSPAKCNTDESLHLEKKYSISKQCPISQNTQRNNCNIVHVWRPRQSHALTNAYFLRASPSPKESLTVFMWSMYK